MKLALFSLLFALTWSATAAASSLNKETLTEIRIDQHIGDDVPMDLRFVSEGREVSLAEITGKRPIVLALVYNRCPMLCDQLLHGLLGTLKVLDLEVGKDFDIVALSFDPNEDTAITSDARTEFLRLHGRVNAKHGVHFLTGSSAAIEELTRRVGFHYRYDEQSKEFAHPSGLVILTPEGKIARYFFGTEFSPRDLRLSLREASDGEVGSVTDDLLLLCYQYDPASGTYSATVVNVIRVGGVATVLALALFVGGSLRRDRRRREEASP